MNQQQVNLDMCCICGENTIPIYKCNQCIESTLCIGCTQNLMEYGHADKCPICRKESPWCILINKDKLGKKGICNFQNICPSKKDIINYKIRYDTDVNKCLDYLAILGVLLLLYLIGISWAKLFDQCIIDCDNWYQNSLEHILRGGLIVIILTCALSVVVKCIIECYNENVPYNIGYLLCVCTTYYCNQIKLYIQKNIWCK